MELLSAIGRCTKCGQDKIQVNGIPTCLLCGANSNVGSGLVVNVEDPGDDALNQILSKVGVASQPGAKPVAPVRPVISKVQDVASHVTNSVQNVIPSSITFDTCVKQAIETLSHAPMPKDLKSFKAINKAIKTLESVLGA